MTSSESDVALMLRVKEGDHEAFRELIERHQRAVINVINRAIGDAWEAEDLAQRVFIQVYRSAPRYKPTAKFTTWLFTITHNTILNEHRRRARHAAESLEAMARTLEGLVSRFQYGAAVESAPVLEIETTEIR
jgi:RNA polymerase sigma-70 factor (ECF subfamily)